MINSKLQDSQVKKSLGLLFHGTKLIVIEGHMGMCIMSMGNTGSHVGSACHVLAFDLSRSVLNTLTGSGNLDL